MAISKKRSPKVDTDNMERVIQQIYTDLNEVIDSINQGETSIAKDEFKGKSGDLRLDKRADGNYQIRGRTDDGWVYASMKKAVRDTNANTGQSCIQFKGPQNSVADALTNALVDARDSHALNSTFNDTEVESALDLLAEKINAHGGTINAHGATINNTILALEVSGLLDT
tara:strand:- start:626 stop:1135 length:510 start_codon:yes stop_codon:yes gene_type:complete